MNFNENYKKFIAKKVKLIVLKKGNKNYNFTFNYCKQFKGRGNIFMFTIRWNYPLSIFKINISLKVLEQIIDWMVLFMNEVKSANLLYFLDLVSFFDCVLVEKTGFEPVS